MSKTHLVCFDPHAHYKYNNNRAEWLGHLINDVKPDTVIIGGDVADMPSLSGYDKGKKSFQGRTYKADIDSHNDWQDRLWSTVRKSKRRMPRRVALIGNHEQRIDRAIELQPELEGTVSYSDLDLVRYYDDVVHYTGQTPGVIEIDGVHYAHYFISGVMGRPVGGEHPAYSLLTKKYTSCTQGHTHVYDHCFRTRADGRKIFGLVAGVFTDYRSDYAGEANDLWWQGCFIKRNVSEGQYDLEGISMARLKKEYGPRR
jgi:hypothetical protein